MSTCEGRAGIGCAQLENRRGKKAQAGGASGKANCLSASAFSPFSADGRSIPAGAHGAQTMPDRPGAGGCRRGTPAQRDRLLAIALPTTGTVDN